jgi:hypothetical protein
MEPDERSVELAEIGDAESIYQSVDSEFDASPEQSIERVESPEPHRRVRFSEPPHKPEPPPKPDRLRSRAATRLPVREIRENNEVKTVWLVDESDSSTTLENLDSEQTDASNATPQPSSSEFSSFQLRMRLKIASSLIDDAINGRASDHSIEPRALSAFFLAHRLWVRSLFYLFAVTLVALAAIEPPNSNDVEKAYLPLWAIALIEMVCYVGISLDTVLKLLYMKRHFYRHKWNLFRILFIIAGVVDALILGAVFKWHYGRPLRFLRPFFVAEKTRRMRGFINNLAKSVPLILDVVGIVMLLIVFYSIFGHLSFFGTPTGNRFMPSFGVSATNFFVLFTTSNFPDIMIPSTKDSLWSAFFFVPFLIIGVFFFSNLIVAVIYDQWKNHTASEFKKKQVEKKNSLRRAFACLDVDNQGYIGPQMWLLLMNEIRPGLSSTHEELLFDYLDRDLDKKISESEFLHICQ